MFKIKKIFSTPLKKNRFSFLSVKKVKPIEKVILERDVKFNEINNFIEKLKSSKVKENEFQIIRNKDKHKVNESFFINSNNFVFLLSINNDKKVIDIKEIIKKNNFSRTGFTQIKEAISVLTEMSKELKITKIQGNSWIFETYPDFLKEVKFKPNSLFEVYNYRKSLKKRNIKKVVYFDYNTSMVFYEKYNLISKKNIIEKMHINEFGFFPKYVLKV